MKRFFFVVVFLIIKTQLFAQLYTVFGYITDSTTGEKIYNALCIEKESNKWTYSNSEGFYSLSLPKGEVNLKFSHAGFLKKKLIFNLKEDTLINVDLSNYEIEEVVVSAEESLHKQTLLGKITIPVRKIKDMPSFVGISDVLKSILFLPGISGGKDGLSNIYVRGGNRDQNLVLIDNIPIYNTNHFPGFVSVVNSNIVKEVDLYKGGFPARYGGKLSSVINIKTQSGNLNKAKGSVNVGILNTDFMINTPIIKKNTSLILAGRTTYYNILSLFSKIKYNNKDNYAATVLDFTFFDIYSKISHKVNNKHHITFSIFSGHDFFNVLDRINVTAQESFSSFGYKQHNTGTSFAHNFIIKPNILFKQSLTYSQFSISNYSEQTNIHYSDTIKNNSSVSTKLADISYKFSFDLYNIKNNNIKIGGKINKYTIQPVMTTGYSENSITGESIDEKVNIKSDMNAFESVFFIEDEIKFSNMLSINAGIRANTFISDTTYFNIEPRISIRYLAKNNFSLKTSYTQTTQPIHILINNVQGMGQEIWLMSNKNMKPQTSQQFSIGFFGKFKKINIEYGIESFYKKMNNLSHYKYFRIDENTKTDLTKFVVKNGEGTAYGIELFIKKNIKRTEATLSYTYSRSTRQFSRLNNGKPFPYIFDKTHDLTLNIQYIGNTYSFGGNFTLNTGTPITLPEGYIKKNKFEYKYYAYSNINNMRLPLYHRLDIFIKKSWISKKGRHKYLSLNIFNVYARQNPNVIYIKGTKVIQKSVFSILPTINFGIKFN